MLRRPPPACTPLKFRDIFNSKFSKHANLNFNKLIGKYVGTTYAFSFQSFMYAILNCLNYLKQYSGNKDEVILPRYSCMTFAHAIIESGLKIRYCDQNSNDLSVDINSFEKALNKNTLAFICVNHLGLVNDMEKIQEISAERNIFLIEDLGYSLGSSFKGKKLGNFGEFSVLNFKEGKSIPISGGMVITNDSNFHRFIGNRQSMPSNMLRLLLFATAINAYVFNILKFFFNVLRINYQRKLTSETTLVDSLDEYNYSFDPNNPNFELSHFQNNLGAIILEGMDLDILRRYRNFLYLYKNLKDVENIRVVKNSFPGSSIHYIRCPIMVRDHRDNLISYLCENNVEAKEMYPEVENEIEKFPGSYQIKKELLTVPCHPGVKMQDMDNTIYFIKKYMEKYT